MVYDGFEQTEGWFFFPARAVVSFCRNNYHGSASQQRRSIAWSHCIFHFQLSSFRVLAFPGDCSVGGRGNRRPDLALTKQAGRPPASSWRSECRSVLGAPASDLAVRSWPQDKGMTGLGSQVSAALEPSVATDVKVEGCKSKVWVSHIVRAWQSASSNAAAPSSTG